MGALQGIACQLLDTDEVELDFDQILAKRPNSRDSGMPWHQDAVSTAQSCCLSIRRGLLQPTHTLRTSTEVHCAVCGN